MNFLLCAVCGLINPVNNMVNVKAGQCLGTARGALVNYAGATVLSLLVVLLTGHGSQLFPAYIASVPWYLYLGSVCGLTAMAIIIKGHTQKRGAGVLRVPDYRQHGHVHGAGLCIQRTVFLAEGRGHPAGHRRRRLETGRCGE